MFRTGTIAVLLLFVALFTAVALTPAHAKWAVKATFDAGTHELNLGTQVLEVTNSKPIVITVQSGTDLIAGIIDALQKNESTRVRIILKREEDTLLFDGEVADTVEFKSATSTDETGHSEL